MKKKNISSDPEGGPLVSNRRNGLSDWAMAAEAGQGILRPA